MSAVQKSLSELHFRIPRQILETVFLKRNERWRNTALSIDEHILNEVVRPRVLVDCDLVGGTEAFISLAGITAEVDNDFTTVYRIPKSKTQGRSIVSVLNITFSDPNRASSYGSGASMNNSVLLQAGQAVMDAVGGIPVTSTATVQLIGENVVMVRDSSTLPANLYLRCVLGNDEAMSHIQLKSYRAFAKLVELAVKAYIFNEYAITMDIGQLQAGQNLGRFKEIVDSYADSEELYDTYLREKWQKTAFMNDTQSYGRYLRMIVGGHR
jgi:hypothetical protein